MPPGEHRDPPRTERALGLRKKRSSSATPTRTAGFTTSPGSHGNCNAAAASSKPSPPRARWRRHLPDVARRAGPSRAFAGTLCFFSKHLPRHGRPRLGALAEDAWLRRRRSHRPARRPRRAGARRAGPSGRSSTASGRRALTVPMITTELISDADPAARPTLETAAALRIPVLQARLLPLRVRGRAERARGRGRASSAASRRSSARHRRAHGLPQPLRLHRRQHLGHRAGHRHARSEDRPATTSTSAMRSSRAATAAGAPRSVVAAPRLPMIALKDFFWEKTAAGWRIRNCPMGEGMVNWKAYFAMLAKAGFHGPVSLHLEYEVPGATPEARRGEHARGGGAGPRLRQGGPRRGLRAGS